MTREEKEALKKERRIARWYNSLPPERQKPLTRKELQELKEAGLADENGLTPAGELKLLQLKTKEWMANRKPKTAKK